MKNSVICPNCKSENPFYNSVCSDCRFYLKDRVYNIDLWSLLSLIIENPAKAFRTIILSEHKNFIFFIFLFLCIKYLINTRYISMITLGEFQSTIGLQLSYLIVFGGTLLYFLSFSFLYTLVGNLNDIFIRFKDTFALIIYSQIPLIFGLVILFTLELVIFGDYLFSINPTPLIIKGSIAFLFLALEIGVIIWSIFLVYKAFHSQSQKLSFSLTATILFFILFSTLIYFYSLFVFTI